MINQERIAVVTGSSTGIGLETSLHLARNGYYTYATMRDSNKKYLIEKISDKEIDLSDIPPIEESFFKNAKLRIPKNKAVDKIFLDTKSKSL